MDCRGFSCMEEMNEYMLAKWNRKIRPNDDVVILGDLSLGNATETSGLIKRLNGRLYLIKGNHDRYLDDKKADFSRFIWVKPYEELSDNKRKVVLCHYPIICYNGQYRTGADNTPKTFMLYGHVHDTMDQRLIETFQQTTRSIITVNAQGEERPIPCNMINCFCMYSDYEPLTLDEWIENSSSRHGFFKLT